MEIAGNDTPFNMKRRKYQIKRPFDVIIKKYTGSKHFGCVYRLIRLDQVKATIHF